MFPTITLPAIPDPAPLDPYYAFFLNTQAEHAHKPDNFIRQCAMSICRLREEAVREAMRAADVIVGFDIFDDGRITLYGMDVWDALFATQTISSTLQGSIKIVPFRLYLECDEFTRLEEAVIATKGSTCWQEDLDRRLEPQTPTTTSAPLLRTAIM